jgi:hypothetical protein
MRVVRWVTRAVAVLIWLGLAQGWFDYWSEYHYPPAYDDLFRLQCRLLGLNDILYFRSEGGQLWARHCSYAELPMLIAVVAGGCVLARRSSRWLVLVLGYAAIPLLATGPLVLLYRGAVGSWPDPEVWASAWSMQLLAYGAAYLWALPWEEMREAVEGPYEEDHDHQDGAIERRQHNEPHRDRV